MVKHYVLTSVTQFWSKKWSLSCFTIQLFIWPLAIWFRTPSRRKYLMTSKTSVCIHSLSVNIISKGSGTLNPPGTRSRTDSGGWPSGTVMVKRCIRVVKKMKICVLARVLPGQFRRPIANGDYGQENSYYYITQFLSFYWWKLSALVMTCSYLFPWGPHKFH